MSKCKETCCRTTGDEWKVFLMMINCSEYVQMQDSSKTVALGQHYMTKDAEEFSQFDGHVACREKTFPRGEKSSEPKGWIRGYTKILSSIGSGDQLPSRKAKHGVDISIESLSKDGSHSWVRISNGLHKFVRDLTEKIRIHEGNETL